MNYAKPYDRKDSSRHQIRKDREEGVGVMLCPETEMKMKELIGCMLLILTLWMPLHLLGAQETDIADPVWEDCGDTEYIDGGDFQHSLIQVLESLLGNASTSGFHTSVKGQDSNSPVYGFVQCRGDLNSSDCKGWASTANKSLLEKCHTTSGFIHVEGCFLRYDNHNFYNDYDESSEFTKICNNDIASNEPDLFANITVEALSKVIEKAERGHTHFATDKFETGYPDIREIYSLAQCWDLSPTNCQSCLAAGRSNISGPGRISQSDDGCESGALGARYLSMNCLLRYEIYSFFNTSIIPSPPPPTLIPPPPQQPTEIPAVSGIGSLI